MTTAAAPLLYWPLGRLMLCADCQNAFPMAPRCPACASEEVQPLARWLNRERKKA